MKYFDLHCDTALALYRSHASLQNAPYAVSLEKAATYERYCQLMAVFTDAKLTDEEGWMQFWAVRENLLNQCETYAVPVCHDGAELADTLRFTDSKDVFLLTVEDVRILGGKLERLEELHRAGVSVITPLWGGDTCIGGSHNTDHGLTDFGRAVVAECFERGIAVDVSHASVRSTDEIFTIAEQKNGKVLATHSNAHAVCPHTRNLTDDQLRRLASLGGIVGVNLYVRFLTDRDACTADDVVRHIDHLVAVMGEDRVAFGADWDGADVPGDLCDISKMPTIAPMLSQKGYDKAFLEKLYFDNAAAFFAQ